MNVEVDDPGPYHLTKDAFVGTCYTDVLSAWMLNIVISCKMQGLYCLLQPTPHPPSRSPIAESNKGPKPLNGSGLLTSLDSGVSDVNFA